MNCWHFITKLLALMQILQLSENTPHVQLAKRQMQAEINSSTGQLSLTHPIKATTVTATTIKTTTTNLKNIKRQYNHSKQQYHGHRQQQHAVVVHSRWRTSQRVYRWHDQHKHWLTREQRHRAAFSRWTRWSECSVNCVQRRERVCRLKRKCGHTKHIEERKCWRCPAMNGSWPTTATASSSLPFYANGSSINAASTTIINAEAVPAAAVSTSSISKTELSTERNITPTESYDNHSSFHDITSASSTSTANTTTTHRHQLHFENVINGHDDRDDADESNFYILRQKVKRKPKSKRNRETTSLEDKTTTSTTNRKRNLLQQDNTLMDGDIFQYEDFDLDINHEDNHYSDVSFSSSSASHEESFDYDGEKRNSTYLDFGKERATPDHLIPRHRRIYSKWSRWTKCSPKCTTRRYKKCRVREQCGREVLREIAYCYTEGSFCQQWLQAQLQKSTAYEMKPMPSRRREINSEGLLSNSIYSDFIMNSKGYRGPEYTPMKLKCGLAAIRNNRRNLYSMLKIIGGKASRKGEWPWQVAIFNRYKEAFCGGTLIAPQWILTAAHCVRKVLYVRLGEHNLDYEDGSELQLRILKSYKHPNFDKKTVDSDVALLRLPKPINTTIWIGYSCLPQPYQPLPKYMDCTVIGWGKRRNRDMAGTSVLHQADVPIIPMDNCRSVYQDYTITKNMFCAGHKRGRIDTCAGDSGGPLLCRDTTKPNHPWTIFGITSFGDGCAKRNKFGIYAKVPNYVDWIWSVINCNGNCKTFQRTS